MCVGGGRVYVDVIVFDVCADLVSQTLFHTPFYVAIPLSSDLPSVPSSSSSQSGATTTTDKGPSPEALTTTWQGMLHAVSLHTSAPHSVLSVGGVSLLSLEPANPV